MLGIPIHGILGITEMRELIVFIVTEFKEIISTNKLTLLYH